MIFHNTGNGYPSLKTLETLRTRCSLLCTRNPRKKECIRRSIQHPQRHAKYIRLSCYDIKESSVRLLWVGECDPLSSHHKASPGHYIPASDLPQLGIQPVPQPIAQEIDCEHREQHGQTWEERDPPGCRQKATAVGNHQAPRWIGWRYADTQETQGAFEENDVTNLDGADDQQGGYHVWENVAGDNPGAGTPSDYGKRHKVLLLERQGFSPYLAGEARPQQQRDDQDDIAETRLGHGHEHYSDKDGGQRQPDVGQTHEDRVSDAATIAGNQPHEGAQSTSHADGEERDDEGNLATVDNTTQHVTAKTISAQK